MVKKILAAVAAFVALEICLFGSLFLIGAAYYWGNPIPHIHNWHGADRAFVTFFVLFLQIFIGLGARVAYCYDDPWAI
jgi:hypothetical protein